MLTMNGSHTDKEYEIAEVLMELAESGHLDHAEGCEVRRDEDGWFIAVTTLVPEHMSLPSEYKGIRLKIERPPGWKGHCGVPKDAQIKREIRYERPSEGPPLD